MARKVLCCHHSQMYTLFNLHLLHRWREENILKMLNRLIQIISMGRTTSMLRSGLSLPHLVFYSQSYCHKHSLLSFQGKNPKMRPGSTQQGEFYHSFVCSTSQAQDHNFFKHLTNLQVIPTPRVCPILSQNIPCPSEKATGGNMQPVFCII